MSAEQASSVGGVRRIDFSLNPLKLPNFSEGELGRINLVDIVELSI